MNARALIIHFFLMDIAYNRVLTVFMKISKIQYVILAYLIARLALILKHVIHVLKAHICIMILIWILILV